MALATVELTLDEATLAAGAEIQAAGGGLPRRITTFRHTEDWSSVGNGSGLLLDQGRSGADFHDTEEYLYVSGAARIGGTFGRISRLKLSDQTIISVTQAKNNITKCVRWDSNRSEVFTCQYSGGDMEVFDEDLTAVRVGTIASAGGTFLASMFVRDDGKWIVNPTSEVAGSLVVVNPATFAVESTSDPSDGANAGGSRVMRASPDGSQFLLSGDLGQAVKVYDATTFALVATVASANGDGSGPNAEVSAYGTAAWDTVADRIVLHNIAQTRGIAWIKFIDPDGTNVVSIAGPAAGRSPGLNGGVSVSPLYASGKQYIAYMAGNTVATSGAPDWWHIVRLLNAQTAVWSKTFDATSFPSGVTLQMVAVPGDGLSETVYAEGSGDASFLAPCALAYRLNAGSWVTINNADPISVSIAADDVLEVRVSLKDIMPQQGQPYIGGSAGEGVTLVYDDPAATVYVDRFLGEAVGSIQGASNMQGTGSTIEIQDP